MRKQKYDLSDYSPDQFDEWFEISATKMFKRTQRKEALDKHMGDSIRGAGKPLQQRRIRGADIP